MHAARNRCALPLDIVVVPDLLAVGHDEVETVVELCVRVDGIEINAGMLVRPNKIAYQQATRARALFAAPAVAKIGECGEASAARQGQPGPAFFQIPTADHVLSL